MWSDHTTTREEGTPVSTEPKAWEGVLARIEERLVDGRLRPGDHLPPERTLAAEFGVARSSVREAVRVLEAMGLIRTQTGSGPTSGAIIIARPLGGMQALMRLQVAASGFPVADVVSTRLLLESSVAGELAERGSEVDLDEAHQLLDAMDDPALTAAEFLALDAQFHLALAEAAGNAVVATMMAGLRSSIEGYVLAGAARLPEWEAMAARLRTEHRAVMAAIADGDAAGARTRIHDHISGYYRDAAPASAVTAPSPSVSPSTDAR